jgi:hypothetical protein
MMGPISVLGKIDTRYPNPIPSDIVLYEHKVLRVRHSNTLNSLVS